MASSDRTSGDSNLPACDPRLQRLRLIKRLLNARRAVRRAEDDGLLLGRLRQHLGREQLKRQELV